VLSSEKSSNLIIRTVVGQGDDADFEGLLITIFTFYDAKCRSFYFCRVSVPHFTQCVKA